MNSPIDVGRIPATRTIRITTHTYMEILETKGEKVTRRVEIEEYCSHVTTNKPNSFKNGVSL